MACARPGRRPTKHLITSWPLGLLGNRQYTQPRIQMVLRGHEFEGRRLFSEREKTRSRKLLTQMQIRIIIPAIFREPVRAPRAGVIRHRIIGTRMFSDPEDRCRNARHQGRQRERSSSRRPIFGRPLGCGLVNSYGRVS
jgi:hypothetical protein